MLIYRLGVEFDKLVKKWYQILKIWTGLKDNFMTLRSLNSSAANCIYYFFGGQ